MSKICCFTGHRDIKGVKPSILAQKLERLLRELIENEGVTDFRAGGAKGFDSVAALCVLKLKKEYPHIKLHLILPCKDQDRYFDAAEKNIYKYTIEEADSVTFLQEKYSNTAMFARNRALVDGSDLCVAFLNKLGGGTYQTVNIARRASVRVINVLKT